MKKVFTSKQKAVVAIEAIKGMRTSSQLAGEYEAHPIQIGVWKKRLLTNAYLAFAQPKELDDHQNLVDRLYRIIGQRDTELEWLKKKLHLDSS
ncbi:MAG: hypothetical protein WAP52_03875 [Candidatus Sungiibacteriota bacterium]